MNDKAQIQWVDVRNLKPHPKNRNKHTRNQIKRLAKIINDQGYRVPIIVSNLSGYMVKGHGGLMAAKRNKLDKVPVIYQDFESEEQEYKFLIADNAIAEWSQLEIVEIQDDLKDLGPINVDLLGIKGFEIDEIAKKGLMDEDEIPEVSEPICKLGDLWVLGEHRLLCGDSTNIQHVDRLMAGEKADMVFTDPPYGVDYQGGSKKREKLKDDHIGTNIYEDVVSVISQFCNGPCYTWYAGTKPLGLYNAVNDVGDIHALIIWNKNNSTFNMNIQYKQKHEPCLYWKPKGKTLLWDGGNKESTVWDLDRESRNDFHPTQKPVALAERAIKNHKAPKVLDLFGGSGSTLIACEKTNRKCYMMEIDPHYCSVIITRWENFTGQKAVLSNGD